MCPVRHYVLPDVSRQMIHEPAANSSPRSFTLPWGPYPVLALTEQRREEAFNSDRNADVPFSPSVPRCPLTHPATMRMGHRHLPFGPRGSTVSGRHVYV